MRYNLQWFAKDGEGGEKTEPATAKKLKDAREEGKVAKSKELNSAFGLIVLFLCLKVFISYVGEKFLSAFDLVYANMADFVKINEGGMTTQAVSGLIFQVLVLMLLTVIPFFIFGFAIAFLVSIIQVGWTVSTKPMKPQLSKFNRSTGSNGFFPRTRFLNLSNPFSRLD